MDVCLTKIAAVECNKQERADICALMTGSAYANECRFFAVICTILSGDVSNVENDDNDRVGLQSGDARER